MTVRQYVEQQFIPWILFLDTNDTIKHFEDKKEQYLCEMYNHVAKEFKLVENYELYMFRINIQKFATPKGVSKLIIAKLPDVTNINECAMLVIVDYGNTDTAYYYLEYNYVSKYDLIKVTKDNKTILNTFEIYNFDEVLAYIKKELIFS